MTGTAAAAPHRFHPQRPECSPLVPVPPPSDFGGAIAPAGTLGYASGLGFTWGAGVIEWGIA